MVAFTQFALSVLALGLGVEAAEVTSLVSRTAALPSFKSGVKWEICIHKPITHNTASDFIPKEAVVWDIDLGHAKTYPNMVPRLKVRTMSPGAQDPNPNHKSIGRRQDRDLLLQFR